MVFVPFTLFSFSFQTILCLHYELNLLMPMKCFLHTGTAEDIKDLKLSIGYCKARGLSTFSNGTFWASFSVVETCHGISAKRRFNLLASLWWALLEGMWRPRRWWVHFERLMWECVGPLWVAESDSTPEARWENVPKVAAVKAAVKALKAGTIWPKCRKSAEYGDTAVAREAPR